LGSQTLHVTILGCGVYNFDIIDKKRTTTNP
jgi:hypothetical protein